MGVDGCQIEWRWRSQLDEVANRAMVWEDIGRRIWLCSRERLLAEVEIEIKVEGGWG